MRFTAKYDGAVIVVLLSCTTVFSAPAENDCILTTPASICNIALLILLILALISVIAMIRMFRKKINLLSTELEISKENFRLVFNRSCQLTALVSPDGQVLDMNESALSFMSAIPEDIEDVKIWDTPWWNSSPERKEEIKSAIKRAASNDYVHFESSCLSYNGELRHLDISINPVRGDYGTISMLIVEARDVTDLKQAEQRFRTLFENSVDAIVIMSGNKCVECNQKALRVYGCTSKDQIIGHEVAEFCPKIQPDGMPSSSQAEIMIQSTMECGSKHFDWKLKRLDGTLFDALVTLNRVELQDDLYIQAIVQDISEKKMREAEHQKLSSVVKQSSEVIMITDLQGRIEYVNDAFEKITGYTAEEAIGETPRMLKSGRHDDKFYQQLWSTVSKGNSWTGRIVNRRKNGDLFTEDTRIFPIRDNEDRIINYAAVKRDVTKELEAEEMLRHSQKMEALGTLAGGVAHDFNNVLTGVFGLIKLCEKNIDKPSKLEGFIKEMNKSSERARDLVRQILSFSSRQAQEIRPVIVADTLADTIELLRSTIPKSVAITTDIESRSKVLADPNKLQQAVMSLCTNAWQAMRSNGGTISVTLFDITVGENEIGIRADISPGEYLKLEISDTGCGIERENITRIFDPYFTAGKSEPETETSSGMGLAITHNIITSIGGKIDVYSEPDLGSTFKIYLPKAAVATDNGKKIESDSPVSIPQGNNETIMLVDDENVITDVLGGLLEEYGYKAVSFNHPDEALKNFKETSENIDIVITDMSMPEMTGFDMAMEMLKQKPEQKIVLCTGFSDDLNADKALKAGISGFMQKPMEINSLLKTLHDIINRT